MGGKKYGSFSGAGLTGPDYIYLPSPSAKSATYYLYNDDGRSVGMQVKDHATGTWSYLGGSSTPYPITATYEEIIIDESQNIPRHTGQLNALDSTNSYLRLYLVSLSGDNIDVGVVVQR